MKFRTFFCAAVFFAQAAATAAAAPATTETTKPNAYEDFVRAGQTLVAADQLSRSLTPEARDAFLQSNRTTLEALRAGFAKRYLLPEGLPEKETYPRLNRFSDLARLLQLEGEQKAAAEDWQGAADSYLDILRLGTEIPRGGSFADLYAGHEIQARGRRGLWSILAELNVAAARRTLQRFQVIAEREVAFGEVLRQETRLTAEHLRDVAVPDTVVPTTVAPPTPSGGDAGAELFRQLMEVEIADAARPYPLSNQKPTAGKKSLVSAGLLLGTRQDVAQVEQLYQTIKPLIDRQRFAVTLNQTQNALLLGALAITTHHLMNDAYPPDLDRLVPEYLSRPPLDPFTSDAPLRFEIKDTQPVLYSIGPDGVDDGGKPVSTSRAASQLYLERIVNDASKGDIVAALKQK